VLAALLAACGGSEQKISVDRLEDLVLTEADVGDDYSRFDFGPQARLDAPRGTRSDPQRFGRQGGWKARYRRVGSSTDGPLVIESRTDVFAGADGARKDLAAYPDQFEPLQQAGDADVLTTTGDDLGDGDVRVELRQGPQLYLHVAWREDNATASVLVSGFAGKVTMADALALAAKQDLRLVANGADGS
jgi:hypothetical protein